MTLQAFRPYRVAHHGQAARNVIKSDGRITRRHAVGWNSVRCRPADALLALLDLVEVALGAEICAAHECDCGNHRHDKQKDYYLIGIHE